MVSARALLALEILEDRYGRVSTVVTSQLPIPKWHDWIGDPWSKGTWLSWPPGWFTSGLVFALEEPEGRLAFAGSDISEDGAGWIEGAVSSGHRAAKFVVEVLGRQLASEP